MAADAPLDGNQRFRLRTAAISFGTLGQILEEAGNAECLQHCQESMRILRRIGDKAGEAVAEFNLGHAYMDLPAIRDLDAAEAAYQRSFDLFDPEDALGRSKCMNQVGMVHHQRFFDARRRNEPMETLLCHAQAAENRYLYGLRLCPKDALTDLAPMHHQLGSLYAEFGQIGKAREHYEHAAQYDEKAGNRFGAGETRSNMAVMYLRASAREGQASQQRAYLLRARAYAEASVRDFQSYQGMAAKDEARGLLDQINQDLAKLPQ
jgi:tetratricopeptide (TPR) repeat protein